VDKGPGDPVFAGTINQTGTFECRVTAAASQSTLARIIHAVEQAQGSVRPRSASSTASLPSTRRPCSCWRWPWPCRPWLFGWTVAAVYKALVLLVIACPCAW
jgi:Cd2+/Zn2+-exporting ATPase